MDRLKAIYSKYREQILYVFFGGLTTLINILIYYFTNEIFGLSIVLSTAIAQILAVLFAYVTNKKYVFKSKTNSKTQLMREIGSFFACRAISFFLDIGFMWVTVELLTWPNMLMKIVSNVIIIVVNYVASKLWIFKKGER